VCVAAGRGSKEEWDIVQPVRSVYGCRRGVPGRHYNRRTEGQKDRRTGGDLRGRDSGRSRLADKTE